MLEMLLHWFNNLDNNVLCDDINNIVQFIIIDIY